MPHSRSPRLLPQAQWESVRRGEWHSTANLAARRSALKETLARRAIDERCRMPDDGCAMSTVGYAQDRRSSRIFMRIRVVVAGKNRHGRRFREACESIVISAHGGLVYSSEPLETGVLLTVTNPFTQEEQECRIVYLGDDNGKGQRVGLEFVTPSPHFWGVEFAQPDWAERATQPTPSPASRQN